MRCAPPKPTSQLHHHHHQNENIKISETAILEIVEQSVVMGTQCERSVAGERKGIFSVGLEVRRNKVRYSNTSTSVCQLNVSINVLQYSPCQSQPPPNPYCYP